MTEGPQMTLNDVVTIVVTVAVAIAVAIVTWTNDQDRRQFMRQCQDDRNEMYTCTAMWRGSFYRLTLPLDVN